MMAGAAFRGAEGPCVRRPVDAADDHDDPPTGERSGLPAAQAPGAVPVIRPELRQGRTSSTPRSARERCTACLLLDVDPVGMVRGKNPDQNFLPDQYVNDRALRRLVLHERGDQPGLRLGPPRSLQGPARAGGDGDPPRRPHRRAAGAGRRAVPAGRVRAAGLRGRGRPPPAGRTVPRVGRQPVLLGRQSARRPRWPTC